MRLLSVILLVSLITAPIFAQDDLMNLLNENAAKETNYTTATFKSTRIMNGHSVERMPSGQLDVRISHRFGTLNSGAYDFFGLDQANMHLSLEYGFFNWMMIGVGRGNYEKTFDGLQE
jgi:hypothetical protein